MVSENLDVIAEKVHEGIFHFALEKGKEERALNGISGVDKNRCRSYCPYAVNQDFSSGNSSEPLAVRVNLRMCVVCVDDDETLRVGICG